jgi:phosphoribosylaminoimidazole (AIR) synthetase
MAVIVPADKVIEVTKIFEGHGETVHHIGTVRAKKDGEPSTTVTGSAGSWSYPDAWTAKSAH